LGGWWGYCFCGYLWFLGLALVFFFFFFFVGLGFPRGWGVFRPPSFCLTPLSERFTVIPPPSFSFTFNVWRSLLPLRFRRKLVRFPPPPVSLRVERSSPRPVVAFSSTAFFFLLSSDPGKRLPSRFSGTGGICRGPPAHTLSLSWLSSPQSSV